jgi:hypothetical protein
MAIVSGQNSIIANEILLVGFFGFSDFLRIQIQKLRFLLFGYYSHQIVR